MFEELEKRYEQAQEKTPVQQPMFMFPDVARKPNSYYVSKEFKEAAGNLFDLGLSAYVCA